MKNKIFLLFMAISLFAHTKSTFPQGDFWRQTNCPYGGWVWSLAINANDHIFARTGNNGVFRSIDNGDNWRQINRGLTNTNVNSIVINSTGYIFAGIDSSGVYYYCLQAGCGVETRKLILIK